MSNCLLARPFPRWAIHINHNQPINRLHNNRSADFCILDDRIGLEPILTAAGGNYCSLHFLPHCCYHYTTGLFLFSIDLIRSEHPLVVSEDRDIFRNIRTIGAKMFLYHPLFPEALRTAQTSAGASLAVAEFRGHHGRGTSAVTLTLISPLIPPCPTRLSLSQNHQMPITSANLYLFRPISHILYSYSVDTYDRDLRVEICGCSYSYPNRSSDNFCKPSFYPRA